VPNQRHEWPRQQTTGTEWRKQHIATITISKTSFLAGCHCPKLIWKKFHELEAFPTVDEANQAVFDQGHRIGALVKLLYPGVIEVGEGIVRGSEDIKETRELRSRRVPLYESAFAIDGGYARIEILVPVGGDDRRAVVFYAAALRHIYVHGHLTANPNNYVAQVVTSICGALTNFILDLIRSDFQRRFAVARSM
jgi:hypothetical protein